MNRLCSRLVCILVPGVLLVGLGGCSGDETRPRAITETRPASAEDLNPPRLGTAERFDMSSQMSQAHAGMDMGGAMGGASMAAGPSFTYELPEGWSELTPTQFRVVNLQVAGHEKGECYLTVLGGEGGGLLENINRWRRQMGQEPIDEAAAAQLPKKTLLGKEAVAVDIRGTYTGMRGDQSDADFALAGLLAVQPDTSYFLRMSGPATLVDAELAKFEQFAASLKVDEAATQAHAAAAAMPPASAEPAAAPFQWDAPAGWEKGPEKAMRLVTYLARAGTCECRAFVLQGEGGGVEANLNRWRQQMGQPALTADELAALPRKPVLGHEAVYIEITGAYTGMSGTATPGQMFLGLVCPLEGRSLFAIMVGPEADMAQEKDNFAAFCASLR